MSNDYQYDDPDFVYVDPATGILRNKHGIDDEQLLTLTEGFEVAKRLEELEDHPILIQSAESLLDIHGYLFQDVYEWAGNTRTVDISKQGTPFLTRAAFSEAFPYVDSLIRNYRQINTITEDDARSLAVVLDALNYLHPFREGNGRAQREFLRVLALEKNYHLNLNPPDDQSVYERYMRGTIEGDVELLAALIAELIK